MRFIVLPDHAGALPLDETALSPTAERILHPSGRPHVVGDWLPEEFLTVTTGDRRLSLIGTFGVDSGQLRAVLEQAAQPDALHGIHATISGSYFVVYSDASETRIWGSLSSFRRVSYSTGERALGASNSIGLLRELAGAPLREDAVALSLLVPRPPWPLSEPSYWYGIENLLPTEYLSFPATRHRAERGERWCFPTERLPLDVVAPLLAEALHAAVAARARSAGGRVSSDLSGGMDSTSLAFFMKQHTETLVTTHLTVDDALNEDIRWARQAGALIGSDPIELAPGTLDHWFATWDRATPELADEPSPSIRTEGMHRAMAAVLRREGSRLHIAGSGGDELYYPDESILPGLMREEPATAVSAAIGMASVHRWPRVRTVRQALVRCSHARWLRDRVTHVHLPEPPRPSAGWDVPFSLSPWATPLASFQVRGLLDGIDVSRLPRALAEADAVSFAMIGRNGQIHRALDAEFRAEGVRYEAPFLDDRIVELSLSVRLSDRLNTTSFKPVLAAASRGVVPDELLGRKSKGDYVSLIYDGYNRVRRDIAAEVDHSPLVARGLVRGDAVIDFLTRIQPDASRFYPFEFHLAADRWLRAATAQSLLERP